MLTALQDRVQLENLSIRDKVNLAESQMRQMPQLELRVEHYFSNGVYARHLFIPKDTILIGKIHKYQNLNILAKGDISVLVDEDIQRIQAPFTIVSPPGTKRIAYTHKDCLWITIHGTELTDVNEIENHFIAQNEQEFLEFCGQLKLGFD